jgi:septal ring factor EnvC (AmiA/AmiB activator)
MKDKLSTSPKGNEDSFMAVTSHRRTNSFSSLAKAYRSKSTNSKLSKSILNEEEDTQQLIAVLEHQVCEGDKARREMAVEIAKLKDQLERAEAQITLLKQANNSLYNQLVSKEQTTPPNARKRPADTERSCVRYILSVLPSIY